MVATAREVGDNGAVHRRRSWLLLLCSAAACGSGGDRPDARPVPDARVPDYSCAGEPDPVVVPDTVTVSGLAYTPGLPGITPDVMVDGALVRAFEVGGGELSRTTSMTDGTFVLVTATSGAPTATYLRAQKSGLLETHLYPPRLLSGDVADLELALFDSTQRDLLEGRAGVEQSDDLGMVVIGVVDCEFIAVSRATVATTPAVGATVYQDSVGIPNPLIESTSLEGFAFLFNVPIGDLEVTASVDGMTFRAVTIPVRPLGEGVVFTAGVGP